VDLWIAQSNLKKTGNDDDNEEQYLNVTMIESNIEEMEETIKEASDDAVDATCVLAQWEEILRMLKATKNKVSSQS
jgi:hypothetical protein